MDLDLTFEEQAISQTARRFAEEHILPRAAEIDEKEEFFFDILEEAARHGLLATEIPEAWGGAEAGPMASVLTTESFARCSATVAGAIGAIRTHMMLLHEFGSDEQKRRWLPRLVGGEGVAALGITEPDAGSDLSGIRTTAVRRGDSYVLNGSKCFTSFGPICDFFFVLAYTDKEKGTRGGMTLFLVEADAAGVFIGPPEKKMGHRGVPLTAETFTDVHVPAANVLGKEGQGFKALMHCFDATRTDVAAQGLGISQACFEAGTAYARERVQFGRPIGDNQAVQWMLVDMDMGIEAGRLLTYKAALMRARGVRCSREAATAKLFCSDNAMKHASDAVQIFGGYGYLKSNPLERFFRDAKVLQIWDGTSQIQRYVIAREILRA